MKANKFISHSENFCQLKLSHRLQTFFGNFRQPGIFRIECRNKNLEVANLFQLTNFRLIVADNCKTQTYFSADDCCKMPKCKNDLLFRSRKLSNWQTFSQQRLSDYFSRKSFSAINTKIKFNFHCCTLQLSSRRNFKVFRLSLTHAQTSRNLENIHTQIYSDWKTFC